MQYWKLFGVTWSLWMLLPVLLASNQQWLPTPSITGWSSPDRASIHVHRSTANPEICQWDYFWLITLKSSASSMSKTASGNKQGQTHQQAKFGAYQQMQIVRVGSHPTSPGPSWQDLQLANHLRSKQYRLGFWQASGGREFQHLGATLSCL